MASIISRISEELHVPKEDLVNDSVSDFLEKELEQAREEIQKIKKEYDITTKEEMEEKIEQGKIEEHPAWENLIEWENLQAKSESIKKWMRELNTKS